MKSERNANGEPWLVGNAGAGSSGYPVSNVPFTIKISKSIMKADGRLRGPRHYEVYAPHVTPKMRRRFEDASSTIPNRSTNVTRVYARRMLNALKKVATVWGGKRLSIGVDEYPKPVRFVCGRGHHFELNARDVRQGQWCPECAYQRYLGVHLGEMRKLAAAHGG
ncbi:hypothetical protein [Caballeronia sordidicola]|uniref:hypothetical protein n=1 Tax=Caballeronia sordidicola TaxID=196367 RepID=UPI00126A5533|nr:hypothetical protein [Caballeronia sordidicola]